MTISMIIHVNTEVLTTGLHTQSAVLDLCNQNDIFSDLNVDHSFCWFKAVTRHIILVRQNNWAERSESKRGEHFFGAYGMNGCKILHSREFDNV